MSTMKTKCHQCGEELIRKSAPSIKARLHFCNNTCKGEYQKTFKPVTREWLVEHYVTLGMDCTQIAHIVKRDPKSVWNWLKDLGIPTRQRGHASKTTQRKQGDPSLFKGMKHSKETKRKLSDIAKADGRVPFDPNVGPPLKGKRGSEVPTWKGGITPERQAFYSSPEWKQASAVVWKRDNGTCQRCGKRNSGKDRYAFDIHHIVSFECVELRAEATNLVLLCEKCHYWIHSAENTERLFIKEHNHAAR